MDGTYELFRSYFGAPRRKNEQGMEVGAVSGLVKSLLALIRDESATYIACAFDHVIESFRNQLYDGYKSSQGVDQELLDQFSLAEEATEALGIVVWPMVEFEADDALATAARRWREEEEVEQIILCSPDKDLAQCVVERRVTCLDRRRKRLLDEEGVHAKFGVAPESIPDWLALVGDSADGFPGLKGWGPKTSSHILGRFHHLEQIPAQPEDWGLEVRGAENLARRLREHWSEALLFRDLATLREDVPLPTTLADLHWQGACRRQMEELGGRLGEPAILERVHKWRS